MTARNTPVAGFYFTQNFINEFEALKQIANLNILPKFQYKWGGITGVNILDNRYLVEDCGDE